VRLRRQTSCYSGEGAGRSAMLCLGKRNNPYPTPSRSGAILPWNLTPHNPLRPDPLRPPVRAPGRYVTKSPEWLCSASHLAEPVDGSLSHGDASRLLPLLVAGGAREPSVTRSFSGSILPSVKACGIRPCRAASCSSVRDGVVFNTGCLGIIGFQCGISPAIANRIYSISILFLWRNLTISSQVISHFPPAPTIQALENSRRMHPGSSS